MCDGRAATRYLRAFAMPSPAFSAVVRTPYVRAPSGARACIPSSNSSFDRRRQRAGIARVTSAATAVRARRPWFSRRKPFAFPRAYLFVM